jgi:hypothetical protein
VTYSTVRHAVPVVNGRHCSRPMKLSMALSAGRVPSKRKDGETFENSVETVIRWGSRRSRVHVVQEETKSRDESENINF